MPETLMASLLDLFNEIEEDRFGWPLQFLHGMINSLPKISNPSCCYPLSRLQGMRFYPFQTDAEVSAALCF